MYFFFFKQKTAYEMRISDWSSDVCSSDLISQPIIIGTWSTLALIAALAMLIMIPFALDEVIAMGQFLAWAKSRGKPLIRTFFQGDAIEAGGEEASDVMASTSTFWADANSGLTLPRTRSEEHKSELQSLMRISDAVF